ncbi:MAG: DNA-3-methyladenine glycosylase, partial [uncultured Solirubrobacteraceae bacterium]
DRHRAGRGWRRPALLRRRRPALRALPRRGVGAAGHRRARGVRAPLARGLPVRPVVADDPRQAAGVPRGVRGLRPGRHGPLRGRGPRAAARRRGHRPQPAEGRRHDRQRPRGPRPPRGGGGPGRARVGPRRAAGRGRSACRVRRPARTHAGLHRAGQGAQGPRAALRGPDDGLRAHAGDRPGERPPGRVPVARGGRGGPARRGRDPRL